MTRLNQARSLASKVAGILAAGIVLSNHQAIAATPDAGALQRDQTVKLDNVKTSEREVEVVVPEALSRSCEAPHFPIKKVELDGITLFPIERFATLTTHAVGDKVCLARLEALARAIDSYYLEQQYFSRTVIPEQDVSSGVARLKVIEAKLGSIHYKRPSRGLRLPTDKERKVLEAQVTPGQHLNLTHLNKGLRNLDNLPGVKASARLVPSVSVSGSDVVVNMDSTPVTSSRVVADNLGSRATGQSRLIYQLFLDSPFGQAERISALAMVSKGTRVVQLGAALPLGEAGGQMQFNASHLTYDIDGPEDLRGSAWSPTLSFSLPQLLSEKLQSVESLNLSYNRLLNDALAIQASDKRVSSLSLRSEGHFTLPDALLNFRLGLRIGDTDLSNNASDEQQDAVTAQVDGRFWRLNADVAYSRVLADAFQMRLRVRGQYSNDNLDSSQKMSLGGRYGVRAYPVGEAAASVAALMQADVIYTMNASFTASAFMDVAWVQINRAPWNGWQGSNLKLPNEYRLSGIGAGLAWQLQPSIELAANLAHRLGNNPGRDASGQDADGRDSRYRAWVELTVKF